MIIRRSLTPLAVDGSGVSVAFGPGALNTLGEIARSLGATRVFLVSDPGIAKAGHVARAVRSLYNSGLVVAVFDEVEENPTSEHVAAATATAAKFKPDFIVGLGGGSSMDTAKGTNFILTNGGKMQDYKGINRAKHPMLPTIAVPTTAGTGSEAQSFALITDPQTHQKMACGDAKALCKAAILDPELTATQPPRVAAATGIDAVAHAMETAVTQRRNDISRRFSQEAWRLLEEAYPRVMWDPADSEAREKMLAAAYLAGAAIENSMLGAAHSLANPLTAHFGIVHGIAVGLMLPHVMRFNAAHAPDPYTHMGDTGVQLARRVEALLDAGRLPRTLGELGVSETDLPALAEEAAGQWTAQFNPRTAGAREMVEIYRAAL